MPREPIVSVILPVFNGRQFVVAAVESIVKQSFQDWELIIRDDCSHDETVELVVGAVGDDSRVRIVRNQANVGLFGNYNLCLNQARGKYIKPFAQDDLLEPECLQLMVSVLEQNPDVSLTSCARRWIDGQGEIIDEFHLFPKSDRVSGEKVILYNLLCLSNWVGEPSTVMFRHSKIGSGFDTAYFHYGDIEYWFRILAESDYYYIDNVLASFRRHSGSASSANLRGLYFAYDMLRLSETYKELLTNIGEADDFYSKRIAEKSALMVDHLVRSENLGLEDVLGARKGQSDSELRAELVDAKTLLFQSYRYLTDVLSQLSDLQCRSDEQIKHLNRQLDNLNNSRSWKILSPARKISAMFKK